VLSSTGSEVGNCLYISIVTASPFNERTIAEFHEKKGRGVGPWGDNSLLMTARGAKSGDLITTPLVYGRHGDAYVVIASKGGAPQHPMWFGNLKANPEVEVEVADGDHVEKFKALARVVYDPAEHDRLYRALSRIWPPFEDYQKRTERVIPVVILERKQ
jgi:deazaflavin-dependent oxidoreductase (nitroreductase family)